MPRTWVRTRFFPFWCKSVKKKKKHAILVQSWCVVEARVDGGWGVGGEVCVVCM